jgi:two-component system OmpR family sensor kinase
MLACPAQRRGGICSRNQLESQLEATGLSDAAINSLAVTVSRSRKKLGANVISTHHGLGYRLEASFSDTEPATHARINAGYRRGAVPAAAASGRLQYRLRRELLALLAGVWLPGASAAGLGLWHKTGEVLNSALTEAAQRLRLLPDAALAVPDTADHLATLARHPEFVVHPMVDRHGALQLYSHHAPVRPLDTDAPDGLRQARGWLVVPMSAADGARRAQVAEHLAHRHEVLWASVGWLPGILLAMLPLAAIGMAWVLRRGFQVRQPARIELAQRQHNDLRPVVLNAAPAELQPGLDAANSLLARVRALVDSERSFAAHTACELRPLLAAAAAQARRPVQRARLVADDFAEAQRSGRLLLQVDARLLPVRADIDALGIALRNLIDNALGRGGDNARVTVHIDGQTQPVGEDSPGVAIDRVADLVRKVARGGASFALTGSGLGLSRVDTIARQSGARWVLTSPLAYGHGFSACRRFDLDLDQRPTGSHKAPLP